VLRGLPAAILIAGDIFMHLGGVCLAILVKTLFLNVLCVPPSVAFSVEVVFITLVVFKRFSAFVVLALYLLVMAYFILYYFNRLSNQVSLVELVRASTRDELALLLVVLLSVGVSFLRACC